VVLLDLVMTGMLGLEVLAKLREINPEVRVLVYTADIQKTTLDEVKAAGAKGLLNKPVNRDQLLAAVSKIAEGGALWS
jgi:DNA-binding NarL/FixJ family response regulator